MVPFLYTRPRRGFQKHLNYFSPCFILLEGHSDDSPVLRLLDSKVSLAVFVTRTRFVDSSMTLNLASTKILPADFQNQNMSVNVNLTT